MIVLVHEAICDPSERRRRVKAEQRQTIGGRNLTFNVKIQTPIIYVGRVLQDDLKGFKKAKRVERLLFPIRKIIGDIHVCFLCGG